MVILASGVPKSDVDYATKEFDYLSHPEMELNNPYTRKIVFATNVAESSLTVKGAVFVIDCGLELEDIYFPLKNANALLEKNIAKSAVKQRRGRVGRTKDGICYHLYTSNDYNNLNEYPKPAIQTSNIYAECLSLLTWPTIQNTKNLEKVLLDNYITDCLLWYTMSLLPFGLGYQFFSKGILQKTSEESNAPSRADLELIGNEYKKTAEFYKQRLINYLRENYLLYSQYFNPKTGLDVIFPELKAYTSPIYLGNVIDGVRVFSNNATTDGATTIYHTPAAGDHCFA